MLNQRHECQPPRSYHTDYTILIPSLINHPPPISPQSPSTVHSLLPPLLLQHPIRQPRHLSQPLPLIQKRPILLERIVVRNIVICDIIICLAAPVARSLGFASNFRLLPEFPVHLRRLGRVRGICYRSGSTSGDGLYGAEMDDLLFLGLVLFIVVVERAFLFFESGKWVDLFLEFLGYGGGFGYVFAVIDGFA
jgi:hypothetical protein